MKFLVLSHAESAATDTAVAPHLVAEATAAWHYYLDGFIREAYFRSPPAAPGAVLIVEADNAETAQQRLDTLPLRRAELVRFEVIPLGPFLPWTALLPTEPAQADPATP